MSIWAMLTELRVANNNKTERDLMLDKRQDGGHYENLKETWSIYIVYVYDTFSEQKYLK